jgi:hypothetical protein
MGVVKIFFAFAVLMMVGQFASAAGFDQHYEVRVGDSDGDGVADDLYVRRKPQIVLVDVGDLPAPIVVPGDVKEVLLEYNGGGFTMRTNLSSAQKNQYARWPIANVETMLGDLNADGRTDLLIKGISALPGLAAALDQILFADTTVRKAPPMFVKGIDEGVRRFFRDLSGHSTNSNYYFQTAIRNHWYHINEGPLVTTFWPINYLRYWEFCWNNCTIHAADSDIDDIFNPNATPALCLSFTCEWRNTLWYARVQAREVELVLHLENFSQSARNLESVMNSLIAGGSLACGSADATAVANAAQNVLGVQVWGGALSNCSMLEHESVFAAGELGRARLGFLFEYLRNGNSALQPKSDRGDPTENQSDLDAALAYLKGSATFRALWAQFQALGLKIVVHRNAPNGSEFNREDRPNEVVWDPDSGMVIRSGIASAAAGLAHEIAHAVRYHTDYKGYMKDIPWSSVMTTDPNNPNALIIDRRPSAEEERAADVEATIERELGEPERGNYADGTNGEIVITDPTYSCFRGNPVCDMLIKGLDIE